jgi:flagellar biosynthesis protein FlhF
MGPQKFIAPNTTEALKLVRQQVGGDAMVLSTRDTPQGVEIVAISPDDLQKLSQQQSAPQAQNPLRELPPEPTAGAWEAPDPQAHPDDAPLPSAQPAAPATDLPKQSAPEVQQLLAEFSQVKQLLQTHLSAKAWQDIQTHSKAKAEALRVMLNSGFSSQLCDELMQLVQESPEAPPVMDQLQVLLESRVQTLDPMSVFDPGGIFAFIGPTGVGKTTAIAKIAARCVLRYGREQLALLTTDTFRIGAQEQLKVYAKIIGVPVISLRDSEDLAAKLSTMGDRRVILMDTAGVSQRDIQMLEQSQLLQEGAPALKRILVMSSTTDLRTQEDVILMHRQAAKSNEANALMAAIITKTDEAAQIGPVLDCLVRHQLPLIFLANGQRVPEDLSQANVPYLSHRALHPRVLGADLNIPDEHIHLLMTDQLSNWGQQH